MLHLPLITDKLDWNFDLLTVKGRSVGLSFYMGYSVGDRAILSQSFVDEDIQFGDEVVVHWGEAGGGYGNYTVPATAVKEIRAIVSPSTPFKRVT